VNPALDAARDVPVPQAANRRRHPRRPAAVVVNDDESTATESPPSSEAEEEETTTASTTSSEPDNAHCAACGKMLIAHRPALEVDCDRCGSWTSWSCTGWTEKDLEKVDADLPDTWFTCPHCERTRRAGLRRAQ
jgi:predicted RNA-binding Zn-ribbon protein involved in translation (DUF1610 family)